MAALVVNYGSGKFHAGFTGIDALRAVSPRLPAVCREVHSRCFGCSRVALGNLYKIFYVPPVFSACSTFEIFARVDFWSPRALKGLGVVLTPGVHSQVLGLRLCIINSHELWTYTLFLNVVTNNHNNTQQPTTTHNNTQHNNTTHNNLGRLRFNRRGASTPLLGVEACSPPSRRSNPIPAIPPYVVKTPHLHGAPTTEETSFVEP